MKVGDTHYRTIWLKQPASPADKPIVQIIDQRYLPHRFIIEDLTDSTSVAAAIQEMHVRGAGLIGAAAGYGILLALCESPSEESGSYLDKKAAELQATRPTAVNLAWAVERMLTAIASGKSRTEKIEIAKKTARAIADEDAECCRSIGEHGVKLLAEIYRQKQRPVQILTHCNAGWLAFVDYGSATAPIYAAQAQGIPLHIWVDETRPRNQGAKLTAWELLNQGVPHTVIADNTGGHLMQQGMVDLVIVGTDRTTATGDVTNKIGTYLKALAAKDNGIPFYVALPSSSFDWNITVNSIPIEERGPEEVQMIDGLCDGELVSVLIPPAGSTCKNYGFDVTPARLINGLITERGICAATQAGIGELFPDRVNKRDTTDDRRRGHQI